METRTNETNAGLIVGQNIPSGKYIEQRWLVAHNAWNTNQNPWNNQCKTITELLDYGVRGFALDVYGDDEDSLHLQHGHGNVATGIKWKTIRDELKTWMDAHPDEIVSLFFESYLEGPERNQRIPESPTTLSALQDSLSKIDCYVAGKREQQSALSNKTLEDLVKDDQRLFAFLEKEPDEGVQSMFTIMTAYFAENVYGDESLNQGSWCKVRDKSNSSHRWKFMNHFGDAPTGSSKDRNDSKKIISHAQDFLFNFHGHYPNFISLDKINCESGDNGPAEAIQKLRLQKDTKGSSGFKFTGNTFDTVHPELGDQPIISFRVNTAKGQGITDIMSLRGGPDFDTVSGVQLINVPGHGIVNMRFKNGTGDWGNWLTEFETTADKKNTATYEVPAGHEMIGFCYRISDGYGAVDFAIAYR